MDQNLINSISGVINQLESTVLHDKKKVFDVGGKYLDIVTIEVLKSKKIMSDMASLIEDYHIICDVISRSYLALIDVRSMRVSLKNMPQSLQSSYKSRFEFIQKDIEYIRDAARPLKDSLEARNRVYQSYMYTSGAGSIERI